MTESITCHEITHAGEGERGRSVEILTANPSPEYAAQEASEYFDDADDLADRIRDENDHHQDTSRVIEVCPDAGPPERFLVRCRIVREYRAEAIEAEPVPEPRGARRP